jgi:predicted O-linked N-acetylglucosamine transferase (SPINDLY family)
LRICVGGGAGPHRMWRDRAARHCNLVDVSGDRDLEAAAVVNDRRMHILFNIMGYTQGERNEIFALQPATISQSSSYNGSLCEIY